MPQADKLATSRLTTRQKAFVIEYAKDFNGTRAAQRAGYSGKDTVLATVASENLRKPNVRSAIQRILNAEAMTAREILGRLADQARADISLFIRTGEDEDDEGNIIVGIDWDAVKKFGYLVKSLTPTRSGYKIELHDSQAALDKLARVHGLYQDRVELTWREQAANEGFDVSSVYSSVVAELTAAMAGPDDAGSLGRSKEKDQTAG